MRSQPEPHCLVCGGNGQKKYVAMSDRLFGAPGEWTLVECSNCECRLLWLNPMPVLEDIHEAYLDYYTHDSAAPDSWLRQIYYRIRAAYLCRRFGYENGRPFNVLHRLLAALVHGVPHLRARFEASVMWLPPKKNGRLLEIGCGRGDTLRHLKALGWEVEGIDVDEWALSRAREHGLTVKEGRVQDLHYGDETFDAIIMSHVIEHLHEPIQVLEECYRMLKRGGRLILLTPNTESLGHKRYGKTWLHLDPPRHLYLFNMDTLSKLAKERGFSIGDRFSVIRDADWTLGASRMIKRKGHYRMGRLPLITKIWTFGLMYFEWLTLFWNKRAGEEIVVIAEK